MSGSEPEPSPPTRERLLQHVRPGLDRRGVPDHEHADLARCRCRARGTSCASNALALADQRLHRHAAAEHADGRAVLGRDVVEVVRGLERARARHVLHHDGRIAGDVLADMAGENAGIGVVAAAGAVADDQVDGLAAVEVGDRVLRAGRWRQRPSRTRTKTGRRYVRRIDGCSLGGRFPILACPRVRSEMKPPPFQYHDPKTLPRPSASWASSTTPSSWPAASR